MSRNSNSQGPILGDSEKNIQLPDAQKKVQDFLNKLDTSIRSNKSFAQFVIDEIQGALPQGGLDESIAYIEAGIQAYHDQGKLPEQELSSIFQIFDIILKLGHCYAQDDQQRKAIVLDMIIQVLEYSEGTVSVLNQLMQSRLDVLKADDPLIFKFSSIFELGFLRSKPPLQQFLFKSLLITLMLNNDVTPQEITHGNWDQSNLKRLSEFQDKGLPDLKDLFFSEPNINLPQSFRQKLLRSALQLRFDKEPPSFEDLEKNQMIDYLRDDQKQSLYRSFKQGLGDLTFEPVNINFTQPSFNQDFDGLLGRYNQLNARGAALGQKEDLQAFIERIGVLKAMQDDVKTIWGQNQVTVSLLQSLAEVLNNGNCPEVYKQSLKHKYDKFGASINISSMNMNELKEWLAESNSEVNNALPDGLQKALRQKLDLLQQQNQAAALAASVSADISGPENLAAALAASEVSADNLDLKNSDPSVGASASLSSDLGFNDLGGNMKVSTSASAEKLDSSVASSAPPAESSLEGRFLAVMGRIHQFQAKLAKINTFESREGELLKVFQSRGGNQEEIEKLKRIQKYLESLEAGETPEVVASEDKSFFAIELKGCWESCKGKSESVSESDDDKIEKYSDLLSKELALKAKQSALQNDARRLSSSTSGLFARPAAHRVLSFFPKDMLVLNQERLNAEIQWSGQPEDEASKQKLKNIINQYKSFWPGEQNQAEAALKVSLQTANLGDSFGAVKAFLDQNQNQAADYAGFAVTINKFGQVSALASKDALTEDSAKVMLEKFLAFNYEGPVYVAASSKNDFDLAIAAANALPRDNSLKVIVSFGNQKREIEIEKRALTLSN